MHMNLRAKCHPLRELNGKKHNRSLLKCCCGQQEKKKERKKKEKKKSLDVIILSEGLGGADPTNTRMWGAPTSLHLEIPFCSVRGSG